MRERASSRIEAVCGRAGETADVAQRVVWSLGATGRFGTSQLCVSASRGVVTLRGRVSSYYQKQLAQTAAMRVAGVEQLENQVEVR